MASGSVTVYTPMEELKKRYPSLSEQKLQQAVTNFKKYDENKDGVLDLMEIKKMLEIMGYTKTHLELKEMVNEVSPGSEVLSFEAFLSVRNIFFFFSN